MGSVRPLAYPAIINTKEDQYWHSSHQTMVLQSFIWSSFLVMSVHIIKDNLLHPEYTDLNHNYIQIEIFRAWFGHVAECDHGSVEKVIF